MNANLPTSSSTVTYTITLKNQGNLKAKLEKIDRIEDDNSNITYSISGVTEGETTLDPGKTNTVTVTMKYADGVTNASNVEKSLMLTFIYVERETVGGSSSGGDVILTTEYEKGTKVELVDGSQWYVTKDSNASDDYVTLFSTETKGAFDASKAVNIPYDPHSSTNIGYYVENTILPGIKSSLTNAGGDVTGIQTRLVTYEEFNAVGFFKEDRSFRTWIMGDSPTVVNNGEKITPDTQYAYEIRPVIIVRKSNISKIVTENLVEQIMVYTSPTADTNINFGSTSGNGLYYTSTNTSYYVVGNTGLKSYYFRGNVTNNYVDFAGQIWRIVRINEDGSIRLITQNNVGTSKFATSNADNTYLGYMYGSAGATSYVKAHGNTNNSSVKIFLDTWYKNNLINYDGYISDSGFCNDRSTNDTTSAGYGTKTTYYGARTRLNANTPQFRCPRWTVDWFTTATTGYGNNASTYPIGLITADEVAYAGGVLGVANANYYLNNGTGFWTMSPHAFADSKARTLFVSSTGSLGGISATDSLYVRPVISLKGTVTIMSGDGSAEHPYKIYTKEESLSQKVLSDNNEKSDSSISFAKTSAEDGTKGLYYTSTNTEGNKTVYYFRGNVTNNYVSFAGKTWRIVRINEDGSIRIVTDSSAGTSAYQSETYDNAQVGFRYGGIALPSYEETHHGGYLSSISDASYFLDTWYENNLIKQSSFIADAGFCNDRSLSQGLGYETYSTYYGASSRLSNYKPQFKCPQTLDIFTLETSSKGNKALDFPVGLLTADEVAYAGNVINKAATSYLDDGIGFIVTMTPNSFISNEINMYSLSSPNFTLNSADDTNLNMYPVINLKSTVKITGGNGTASNPYVVAGN